MVGLGNFGATDDIHANVKIDSGSTWQLNRMSTSNPECFTRVCIECPSFNGKVFIFFLRKQASRK